MLTTSPMHDNYGSMLYVTHVISRTRLPLFSRETLKRSGSLGTRLQKYNNHACENRVYDYHMHDYYTLVCVCAYMYVLCICTQNTPLKHINMNMHMHTQHKRVHGIPVLFYSN